MKLFQNLINQIKEVIESEFGIMDDTGLILACSDETRVGQINPGFSKMLHSRDLQRVADGVAYQKIFIRNKLEFITFIASEDENSLKYLSLISVNMANIKLYHEEKFDKLNFLKEIITENILPGEISFKAKELHIAYNAFREVFLIKLDKTNGIHPHEVLQSLFPNRNKDFVLLMDDESIVLIKELKSDGDLKEIDNTGRVILDTLNTELMVKAYIGIGTVSNNIKDLARSYTEAQTALLIGSIFENEKAILKYSNLGLGRLIYQLPASLCKLFMEEVFNKGSFESLDAETMLTIQKFFENNLNISETSRQLYVHRNTLVYRLDKIQKVTGLDLRKFDDAIIFKVSMLVKRYLDKTDKN